MSNQQYVPEQQGWFAKLLKALMNPFAFLKEVLSNHGIGSSKRTVMVICSMVLCSCLVALTAAIIFVLVKNPKDHKIDSNIVLLYTSLTVPIATLAGAVYIKKQEEITKPKSINTTSSDKEVIVG